MVKFIKKKKKPKELPQSPIHALGQFKQKPDGPDALQNLKSIFEYVESLADLKKRRESAQLLAGELSSVLDGASPAIKPKVAACIGLQLSFSPLTSEILRNAVREEQSRKEKIKRDKKKEEGDRSAFYRFFFGSGKNAEYGFQSQYITPDDPTVLAALRQAVSRKGPLALNQIFDIFDYVAREIEYLYVSHPTVPRSPAITLGAKIGDCKCMSVALASMLEAIGAKTLLSVCTYPDKSGHEYVGVLVARSKNKNNSEYAKKAVTEFVRKRYGIFIKLKLNGQMDGLEFRDQISGLERQTYLMLDATQGRCAIPGVLGRVNDSETFFHSRPYEGNVPKLE
jgi:hypothetical protein